MTKFYNLQMFAGGYTDLNGSSTTTSSINVNVTNQRGGTGTAQDPYVNDLTIGMKTFYDTALLENAREQHYFAQFGKKQGLPKNNGKTVEWRKWDTFGRAQVLTEGVTPNGDKFGQTNVTATIVQHGAYAVFSDVLELTYYDDIILGATEEYGAAAAESMDLDIRDAINASSRGFSIMFPPKASGATPVETRADLGADSFLTPIFINKVATVLKKNKAPKINGKYVAIIHPSVAMDLRNSDGWLDVHKYSATTEIFNGEIGELHGVRFIETNNAKVYGAGTGTGDSGLENLAVYRNYFFGKDAWGCVDPAGAGLEMIIKQKGSGGTADPLNQRSSVGYKFSQACEVLYPERLVCVECVSSFGADDATN